TVTTASVTSGTNWQKMRLLILCSALIEAMSPVTNGAPLQGPRVSEVIQDVRLLEANVAARPAAVNDEVRQGTAVRTGVQWRRELPFVDPPIPRLGKNRIFRLVEGAREVHVDPGSFFVEVPPTGAPAKIISTLATVGIAGGTGMFGTGPPAKFMVLEGI